MTAQSTGLERPSSNIHSSKLEKESRDRSLQFRFSFKITATPPPRPVVLGELKQVQPRGKSPDKAADSPTLCQVCYKQQVQILRCEVILQDESFVRYRLTRAYLIGAGTSAVRVARASGRRWR